MENYLMFYKVITPMHMGAGNKIGTVDMPIQREGHTGFPKMEASGIKGVFRDGFERFDKSSVNEIFGSEDTENGTMGKVNFTDGKILFFPMRSYKGVFALVTCPMVLERFIEDTNSMDLDFELKTEEICEKLKNNINDTAFVYEQSEIIYNENGKQEVDTNKSDKVMVEEFIYDTCKIQGNLKGLIDKIISDDFSKKRVLIVPDLDFRDYVEMYTEINTRIKIGDNGVVVGGALFTEEYLPAETIMYGFVSENSMDESEKCFKVFKELIGKNQVYQFGGNTTIGKGITKIYLV